MNLVLLIGGGGHCRSIIELIEAQNAFGVLGVLDLPELQGREISGYPVLGTDEDLEEFLEKCRHCLVTLGAVGTQEWRIRLFNRAREAGYSFPVVVSPRAWVSPRSIIEAGTVVHHGSVINVGARIGANSIINSMALVEHDAEIGNHCHVSTGARVNGGARVGQGCFIGSGAVVLQGVQVVAGTVVGAMACVTKDIREPGIYVGTPAHLVRKHVVSESGEPKT